MKLLNKMPILSEENRNIWREIEAMAYSVHIMISHLETIPHELFRECHRERVNAYGEMFLYQISQLLGQVTIQYAWCPFTEQFTVGEPVEESYHQRFLNMPTKRIWFEIYIRSSMVSGFDAATSPFDGGLFEILSNNTNKTLLKQLILNTDKAKMFATSDD